MVFIFRQHFTPAQVLAFPLQSPTVSFLLLSTEVRHHFLSSLLIALTGMVGDTSICARDEETSGADLLP